MIVYEKFHLKEGHAMLLANEGIAMVSQSFGGRVASGQRSGGDYISLEMRELSVHNMGPCLARYLLKVEVAQDRFLRFGGDCPIGVLP